MASFNPGNVGTYKTTGGEQDDEINMFNMSEVTKLRT